jgi:hypothetical protein
LQASPQEVSFIVKEHSLELTLKLNMRVRLHHSAIVLLLENGVVEDQSEAGRPPLKYLDKRLD